jgi:isoleucyl-tRNA synthetase
VLGVVKEVFLPWYNAFRFFVQNVERFEAQGKKFLPSLEKVVGTTNATDIWISAATQGLIKFVHQEMVAYRLYTVMPALVSYVTQLTNWYVRLNRDRLKGLEGEGEEAESEAETGLQVLYDVLLNVTILMGPFTPFITEYFYQHLRKLQPSFAEAANGGGSSNPPMVGKSDSVHFLTLPAYDESRLNPDAVEAMEALQGIVEQGRTVRERRNISLRTPIKSIVAILRDPSENVVRGITGPLKKYILSELNAWDFVVVPKEQEHEWVTLSLTPNFNLLGKKLGKKMGAVQAAIKALSHQEAVTCLATGKLMVEEFELDAETELISRLAFSKVGEHWEATVTPDGSLVVGVDCTQDEAILSAGMARELMNHIQQLRKAAGLDLKDSVEIFFEENENGTTVESAVAHNVEMFVNKFKGVVPLPKTCAPAWSVVVQSDVVDVGGASVRVSICRPAVAAKDDLDESLKQMLSTFEAVSLTGDIMCVVDGKESALKEGEDYWKNAVDKARALKSVAWL